MLADTSNSGKKNFRGPGRSDRGQSARLAAHAPCGLASKTVPTDRAHPPGGGDMLLIREIMYCKPGKVRPLVEKFLAMNKLGVKAGMPPMRVMTDFSAERYWMLVGEMEVESLAAFEKMMSGEGMSEADGKEMENLMKGYHDLVDHGRREIYKLES
jgi:hypothetical protein